MAQILRLFTTSCVILMMAVVLKAQDNVPKSVTDLVLPDADAQPLIQSLKGHEIRSLASIQKIYVVSDRVTLEMIAQGFKINEMIDAIKAGLRAAKINPMEYNEFKTMWKAGFPFLKIKLEVTQDGNKNSYNGLVKVALTQQVVMLRGTNTTATAPPRPIWTSNYYPDYAVVFAETWHTQKPVQGLSREDISRLVIGIVLTDFLKDLRQANTPATSKAN